MVTAAPVSEPSTSGRDHGDKQFGEENAQEKKCAAAYIRASRPWHSLLGVRIVSAQVRHEVRHEAFQV